MLLAFARLEALGFEMWILAVGYWLEVLGSG